MTLTYAKMTVFEMDMHIITLRGLEERPQWIAPWVRKSAQAIFRERELGPVLRHHWLAHGHETKVDTLSFYWRTLNTFESITLNTLVMVFVGSYISSARMDPYLTVVGGKCMVKTMFVTEGLCVSRPKDVYQRRSSYRYARVRSNSCWSQRDSGSKRCVQKASLETVRSELTRTGMDEKHSDQR